MLKCAVEEIELLVKGILITSSAAMHVETIAVRWLFRLLNNLKQMIEKFIVHRHKNRIVSRMFSRLSNTSLYRNIR